ncbi:MULTISPECIES: PAS domain-containing protein [unclassified Streptomyces]|uniref:PAS domain-containing protein n=1 Tax=unclassified Streptomyces TaxID=2593676 RepID=UPI003D93E964
MRPRATVLLDADGLISEWNEDAVRLPGYPAEEVVGRPLSSLLARPSGTAPPSAPAGPPMRGGFRSPRASAPLYRWMSSVDEPAPGSGIAVELGGLSDFGVW